MRVALLVLFSVLLATGQVLFKKAATAVSDAPLYTGIFNVWTLAALVLYAGATILWISILRTTPLSIAYPFVALGFIFVPIAAHVMFDEQIGVRYMLGSLLIVFGILLTSR